MKVDHCGDLLLEPNSLRQQPSTTSSHCSGQFLQANNIQFSELNQIEVPVIGCKAEFIIDSGEQRGVLGFTLNEEQWSLFSKSHLVDLEPYERRKMCSLPKSFTPFASTTVGDGGLECERNMNRSASNSILLRKCESLNPTPSQYLLNGSEPNNNNIAHPSSLSKLLLLRKSEEGFQEDEKENWLSDEGWNKEKEPEPIIHSEVTDVEASVETDHAAVAVVGDVEKEGSQIWEGSYHPDDHNEEGEVEVEFLPTARFPLTHSSTAVGTIGSHPNPILCCATDQPHQHQHQDLSISQQTSFPSTVYNFHSIDPLLYAECYDDWNANVASLCEKNINATPVVYQDVMSMNVNGFTLQPQLNVGVLPEHGLLENYATTSDGFGKEEDKPKPSNGTTGAIEEVNTLSTFLSKFDDKVAAIWGQQGSGRNALGANLLSADGYISSASTPLGSSNPWGSPSSDISAVHGASEYRLLPSHQQTKQMSLAEDALLSAGYGYHHRMHDPYQCDQQAKSQGRLAVCDLTISPPKGNYNIMHSMKQYFGTAPPESEYHIIKRNEALSSEEELEKSLAIINHDQEKSGFAAINFSDTLGRQDDDVNKMAKALDSLDLENEADEEWEIMEACSKGKPQGHDGEDLLNSWKTHFRTVEQVETIASARGIDLLESPITAISAHQINPNLPEYRLFDIEVDGEYHVFDRPGQTMFPVKYKVSRENEKGNQTEDIGVDMGSPYEASSSSQSLQAYRVASEWAKYQLSVPTFEFSSQSESLGTIPSSTTPTDPQNAVYDGESGAELHSLDWYNLPKGIDYSGMWGGWALGDDASNTLLPMNSGGGEYCDSGVGGVGSRSEFYDDMFGEYEGDYENFSGVGFAFPGFIPANDVDTDYGQFQDVASLAGCDSTSVSGKQGKSNRRNKARLRPCKYYFMEGSCRRGNDCKFSHDSVTCRYWAEGSCLKGQACPYVHCFIDEKKVPNQDDFVERTNGIEDNQYHLESETDFPALCSTKNSMLSSRQPMTLGFPSAAGEGVRRLEDSLESLTVFTDSNSSVIEEEINEPRRLFLFERLRASPPPPAAAATGSVARSSSKKQNSDNGKADSNKNGKREVSERHHEAGNRTLSKSKSVGDANSSSQWTRNSVSRSSSHSFSTGMSLGIPIKEKRKKKKH